MAFHGTPKIHADLPPGVRQGGVEGVGFSASGEAGGLHVFRGCQCLTHCAGWRLQTEASMFMSGWLVVCTGITVRVSRVKDVRGDVHTGIEAFFQAKFGHGI